MQNSPLLINQEVNNTLGSSVNASLNISDARAKEIFELIEGAKEDLTGNCAGCPEDQYSITSLFKYISDNVADTNEYTYGVYIASATSSSSLSTLFG